MPELPAATEQDSRDRLKCGLVWTFFLRNNLHIEIVYKCCC